MRLKHEIEVFVARKEHNYAMGTTEGSVVFRDIDTAIGFRDEVNYRLPDWRVVLWRNHVPLESLAAITPPHGVPFGGNALTSAMTIVPLLGWECMSDKDILVAQVEKQLTDRAHWDQGSRYVEVGPPLMKAASVPVPTCSSEDIPGWEDPDEPDD